MLLLLLVLCIYIYGCVVFHDIHKIFVLYLHITHIYSLYIYSREQEVENEMIQEMSVNGRIRAFERKIKQNNKNGTGET